MWRLALCWAVALALVPAGAQAQGVAGSQAVQLYQLGLERQTQDDLYRAIELYKASLAQNPAYVLPMVGLAECYRGLGEHEEGLRWVSAAERLDRENTDLWNLEGALRTALGQLPEARALYERVLQRVPNDVAARLGLARLDVADGRRRQAALRLLDTLRVAPDEVRVLLELAVLTRELGEPESSAAYLRRALDRYSDDPEVHLQAGLYFLQEENLEAARSHLLRALALKPNYPEAEIALSRTELAAGRMPAAIDAARRVLTAGTAASRQQARYQLAAGYEGSGDVESAARAFAEALRMQTDDEVARLAAENLVRAHPDQAADLRAQLAAYHSKEGKKLEERNMLSAAQLEFRRSLLLDPASLEARKSYAAIYRLRGFPVRTLMELIVLRDFYGHRDTEITDQIEITTRQAEDTPASRWRDVLGTLEGSGGLADQYGGERPAVTLGVCTVAGGNRELHFGASGELVKYAVDLLMAHDGLSVRELEGKPAGFDEAFAAAREAGVDYFVVFVFDEGERSLRAEADVYLTRTGSRMAQIAQMRTGNNRVRDAMDRLTAQAAALFPMRGVLLGREFDRGLVDLGKVQGLAADTKLLIVRRDALSLKNDSIGFAYGEPDVVGELVVTAVDEAVSEGRITPRSFFDLVNPGDYLIAAPEGQSGGPGGTARR